LYQAYNKPLADFLQVSKSSLKETGLILASNGLSRRKRLDTQGCALAEREAPGGTTIEHGHHYETKKYGIVDGLDCIGAHGANLVRMR